MPGKKINKRMGFVHHVMEPCTLEVLSLPVKIKIIDNDLYKFVSLSFLSKKCNFDHFAKKNVILMHKNVLKYFYTQH